jgi:membrane protein implicated in regulation of membrane protease activity
MRRLVQLGSSGLVLLLMMLIGGLVLWVGIPLAWLWIGSQIQAATGSLGAAVGAMLFGVVASIVILIPVLGWLSNKHRALLVARGHEDRDRDGDERGDRRRALQRLVLAVRGVEPDPGRDQLLEPRGAPPGDAGRRAPRLGPGPARALISAPAGPGTGSSYPAVATASSTWLSRRATTGLPIMVSIAASVRR